MSVAVDIVSAEAAGQALSCSADIIAQLRRYEVIAGAGDLVDLEDAARVVAELRAAVAPVAGQPMLISQAAEQYGFSVQSIQNWIRDGWVKVLIPEPRRKVDLGDVALAKAIADRQGHIKGRAVFPAKPRSGRPKKKA
jgi:hypothetical protein